MFIGKAIKKINPDAQFRITERGEEDNLDIAIIDWLNGTTPISKADIQTQLDLLIAEYDAKEYARTRKRQYPHLREFAEAYCEKEIGGDSTKWDAYIVKYNKVRSDNSK